MTTTQVNVTNIALLKKIPQNELGDYDLTVFDTKSSTVLQWLCEQTNEQLNKLTINEIIKQAHNLLRFEGKQPLFESQVLHLCAIVENTFNIEFDIDWNLPSLPEHNAKGGK